MDVWGFEEEKPKKRRQLTHAQKIYAWENNSHTCDVCLKRVTKLSDAEFDHKRAYSKGGATNLGNVVITHRQCNRLKGNKTLSATRRVLGIKAPKKKRSKKATGKRKTRKADTDPFGFGSLGDTFRL